MRPNGKSSRGSRRLSDPRWIPCVKEVRHLGGHRLYLRFDDGSEGEIDLGPRLVFDGVFAPLSDPTEFGKVHIDEWGSTIEWNDQVNLDPVTLYCWLTGQPLPGTEESAPRR